MPNLLQEGSKSVLSEKKPKVVFVLGEHLNNHVLERKKET